MSTSVLLYPGGVNPPLDGITPVFEQVGADPSAGGGLDRPPGSIARFGAVYYWKIDVGPTAWTSTPFSGGGGGGGITNVTGTNGVTVTTPGAGLRNATNDLVTGADVAQLNVDSLGGATIDTVAGIALTAGTSLTLTSSGAGDVVVNAARDELHTIGRNFDLTAAGGASLEATGGDLELTATGANDLLASSARNIAASANGDLILTGATAATLETTTGNVIVRTNAGAGGILIDTKGGTLPTAHSIRLNSDEDVFVHADDDVSIAADDGLTLGSGGPMLLDSTGNLTLSTQAAANDILLNSGDDITANAADRITLVATNLFTLGGASALFDFSAGPITIAAGDDIAVTTGGGDFNVDAGAGQLVFAGAGLSFFGGGGNGQKTHINDPTGGTVIDAEVRIAVVSILDALEGWGLMEA